MKKILYVVWCVLALVACNNPKQAPVEEEATQTWPDLLQRWAGEYNIDDPQRLALIDLVDSVYYLIIDSTVSEETLEGPICRMTERIEEVLVNDSLYGFTQMMRASAQYISYCIIFDENRASLYEYGFNLISDSFLWHTYSGESMDMMYTSLFDKSWEAIERKANITLSTTDDDTINIASIVITNFYDYAMENIKIAFDDEEGNPMGVFFEKDFFVDSTNADKGVKEILLPMDVLMKYINLSSTWSITYETSHDTVSLAGVPNYYFYEQLRDCPRLLARMEKIRKQQKSSGH